MFTRSGRIRVSNPELSPSEPIKVRKRASPSRSPARARKISPSRKSPTTARASNRSPARKSPSRKPPIKSPARKSPARNVSDKDETYVPAPTKRPALKANATVVLSPLPQKVEIYHNTRSKRSEYSISDISSSITVSEYSSHKFNNLNGHDIGVLRERKSIDNVRRRSSRLRESNSMTPADTDSHSKSLSKSIDTYSDDEHLDEKIEKSKVIRKLSTPLRSNIENITYIAKRWEFGGRLGSAILMVVIPLTVSTILMSCKSSCSLQSFIDLSPYKTIKLWFNYQAWGYVISQLIIQSMFAVFPIFGTISDRMDDTGTKYCFNAFFSSMVTVSLLFGLDYYHIVSKDYLLAEYLKLAVASYIIAVVLSINVYLKSAKVDSSTLNVYGNTGYTLYDFFIGKQINPNIKGLDVKIWISRASNINALILLVLILTQGIHLDIGNEKLALENYEEFINKVHLRPTLLIFSLMQIIYILNFIKQEYKITATFFWHSEGVGYMQIVSSALYPFYFTTISKYVADADVILTTNTLIFASVLFVLGFCVMLFSNNIKYEFRKNPLHPILSKLPSLPTFHGKKLLISSMWGVLRHPNYAGDILIHIALSLPGILTKNFIAAAPAIITIVMLLHRAWRDDARCQRRYGAAWQRYCKSVPCVIIPKIL